MENGKYYPNKPLEFYRHDELTTLVFYWCPLQIFWIVCRLQLNYQRFYRHAILLRDPCLNLWPIFAKDALVNFLAKNMANWACTTCLFLVLSGFLDPIENSLKFFECNRLKFLFTFFTNFSTTLLASSSVTSFY
jgi:hypothetical protein